MAHLLKYEEWQGGSGRWYCNDTSDLGGIAGLWWVPARMLQMEPATYVKWVIETYKPDEYSWNGKTFLFSWSKQADMRKFKNHINALAREKQFFV